MKILTKIIKACFNALMIILIIMAIALTVIYFAGIHPYVVKSGSMESEITVGSLCFINTKVQYEDIKENDIIAFNTQGDTKVTHRVVAITENGIETKGDANHSSDGITTTKENYYGKTLCSIPKIGFLVYKLQTPKGRIIAITAIIAIFLIGILLDEFNKDKEKDETKEKDKGKGKEKDKVKDEDKAETKDKE